MNNNQPSPKLIAILICLCLTVSYSQEWEWAEAGYGDTNANVYGIVTDDNRNSYVTGMFRGSITFGTDLITSTGESDMFLLKYDENGGMLWATSYGIASDNWLEAGEGIDIYGSNIYVAGRTDNHVLMKYDFDGNLIWGNGSGSTNHRSFDVATDLDGNAYLTGYFGDDVTFGMHTLQNPLHDNYTFVTKYSPSGNVDWAVAIEASGMSNGRAIDVDADGNSYVGVMYTGSLFSGNDTLVSHGQFDIALVKIDPNGNILWTTGGGGPLSESCYGVEVDDDGDVYISANNQGNGLFGGISIAGTGSQDALLIKLDSNGNVLWIKNSGGSGHTQSSDLHIDEQGNILMSGYYFGTTSFDAIVSSSVGGSSDGFVAKYDHMGNAQSLVVSSSSDFENFTHVTSDNAGNVLLTGVFSSSVQLGSLSLTDTTDDFNVLTAKYSYSMPTSVSEQENIVGYIHPNPFSQYTTIEVNHPGKENYTMKLYNLWGQCIRTSANITSSEIVVDRGSLTNGLYFFQLLKNKRTVGTGKLIVE